VVIPTKALPDIVREMWFIFEYYPDTLPSELSAEQIEKYICYIKQVFNSGRDKCRMLASSVSFFFKQVLKRPYDLPSKLYPRKAFKLPNVMTADEVRQLLSHTTSIKQKAIVELFYSSGIRLEEGSRIKIADIDSKNMRIKVVAGKGNEDAVLLTGVRFGAFRLLHLMLAVGFLLFALEVFHCFFQILHVLFFVLQIFLR
jgi:site-specific recombinase XerD